MPNDRCTKIAKRKYKKWPSAYASGAVVRCRKGKIWKNIKEQEELGLEENEYLEYLDEELHLEEQKKAGSESSKEKSLHDWFKRKGESGKKSGWVDCNTCRKDKKTGRTKCKACGREQDEKRSKYPACRPTPAACKEKGKGKSWGKKSNMKEETKMNKEYLKQIIKEEIIISTSNPGFKYHFENQIPLTENIYRPGSPCYFNVIKEARKFFKAGYYQPLNEEEYNLLENSDLGEWSIFEGERVPLDFPMFEDETLDESKKKKDPPLNKPTKNVGSGKKWKVYVRNPKTGNIKKITYGDAKGGLKGNWNSAEARKSFAARHDCINKKDKTTAGYWACRAHKDFGPGIGRFW